ncbi:MAG TPA: CDP-alcohol phosphatidyltransferase family protein [Myxococcota bacterium]|nr:CDP-alcohol phosphatidyltransferase family protein [Myxococcota bacterium]
MTAAPSELEPAPAGWVVRRAAQLEGGDLRIWGLAPEERLLRSLRRAGCGDPRIVDEHALPCASGGAVIALRGDVVLDERLVEGLVAAPDTMLVAPDLGPIGAHVPSERAPDACAALARADADALPGVRRAGPPELAPAYVAKLRKREPPYVFAARANGAAELERRTFEASYKGLTDLVTKWVWPRPARAAVRWCAEHRVHPNAVTLASGALTVAVALLFARGAFGAGLVCAWAMTFLDTVDGKLARVTLTTSRLGDVMDHGLDLIHPPFWWWAWGIGLGAGHAFATAVVVIGYAVGRALEGAFLARFGFETHSWRPIDGLFRTITARRNPNLILLSVGAIAHRPDLGLVMVALWTVASVGFHALRLAQAEAARARGAAPVPWEEE